MSLIVNRQIQIAEDELHWSFVRASGPGGQNVNKVASKAVLRWNVTASPSLPDDVRARLQARQRRRISTEGNLILSSQRYRDQGKNIEDCKEKLCALVRECAATPRPRKATKPTRGARERRLKVKKQRSALKSSRRLPRDD